VKDPHARDLLWDHTRDANNRVAGNSLVGLHLLGEERVVGSVLTMANNPLPEFRWTAAWAMSKIGSPQFVPPLNSMIKDDNPGVRRSALKALASIHKEVRHEEAQKEKLAQASSLDEVPKEQVDLLEQGPTTKPDSSLRLDGTSFSYRSPR
jgi:HEAT repeat protein